METTDQELEPLDAEFAELDDGLVNVAQTLIDSMDQLIELQRQQIQMMAALSQQIQVAMLAPKRVVRDAQGKVIGSEPVLG